jgi:ABC-type multidrug transport system ATPase subunit
MTVFLRPHLLFEVEQICDHVTIINRGEALVSDTVDAVSGMILDHLRLRLKWQSLMKQLLEP